MNHISKEQIMRLAELYAEGLPYLDEDIQAFQHISECEDCYADFCCAASIYEATSPEAIARVLPINEGASVPVKSLIANAKAIIRVFSKSISNAFPVSMEQVADNLGSWLFEPSMAFSGARGIEDEEKFSNIACLEDVDSRYTFVRYNAETGELHIQIDTEESAVIPEKISLQFSDGHTMDLELTKGDRFVIADAKGLPSSDFEIIFS